MSRHNSLSGSDPRYTAHLFASHRSGQEENCSKDGYAGSPPEYKWSTRNGVVLHKQLIRPMMDYACPAWRPAARTHVRRLQVLQSECLRLATGAPWHVSSRQILEDLSVPLFADHIRALTASSDSKLADVGNPKFGNSADTYTDRGLTPSPDAKAKGGSSQQASRGHR
jgi:hypothetical protein